MVEVNIDNVQDWTIYSLEKFRETLSSNINLKLGEVKSQELMLKLIKLEIDRKNRIKRINLGADLKKEKIIKKAKGEGIDFDQLSGTKSILSQML